MTPATSSDTSPPSSEQDGRNQPDMITRYESSGDEMEHDRPTFMTLIDRLTSTTGSMGQGETGQEAVSNNGLLVQLRDAAFGGLRGMSGPAVSDSTPPVDAAAFDLLTEITNQAADALSAVSRQPAPSANAEHYLLSWAGQTTEDATYIVTAKATTDPDSMVSGRFQMTAYRIVERWTERIEDFFNPTTVGVNAPCPECGERHTQRMTYGETIRTSAVNIRIDKRSGLAMNEWCESCGVSWPRVQFEHLARIVGVQPGPDSLALAAESGVGAEAPTRPEPHHVLDDKQIGLER